MTGSLEALLDDALLEKVQGALSTILFDPSVAAEQKGGEASSSPPSRASSPSPSSFREEGSSSAVSG